MATMEVRHLSISLKKDLLTIRRRTDSRQPPPSPPGGQGGSAFGICHSICIEASQFPGCILSVMEHSRAWLFLPNFGVFFSFLRTICKLRFFLPNLHAFPTPFTCVRPASGSEDPSSLLLSSLSFTSIHPSKSLLLVTVP